MEFRGKISIIFDKSAFSGGLFFCPISKWDDADARKVDDKAGEWLRLPDLANADRV